MTTTTTATIDDTTSSSTKKYNETKIADSKPKNSTLHDNIVTLHLVENNNSTSPLQFAPIRVEQTSSMDHFEIVPRKQNG